jgi:hypothetical protein
VPIDLPASVEKLYVPGENRVLVGVVGMVGRPMFVFGLVEVLVEFSRFPADPKDPLFAGGIV